MKRISCLFLIGILIISLSACHTSIDNSDANELTADFIDGSCTKDSVDEFMAIIGDMEPGRLYAGTEFDKEHCFNVTPLSVASQTDIKIFKFSDSCASLALIDGEVYSICESFGGYGFVNAVPWDYDADGNHDLLVASSYGSGLHRSIISVFNTQTKESTIIYDTSTTDNPSVDLFVAAVSPSLSSKRPSDLPVYYQVYTANIKVNNNNLADLSYTARDVIGSIEIENGVPVFKTEHIE